MNKMIAKVGLDRDGINFMVFYGNSAWACARFLSLDDYKQALQVMQDALPGLEEQLEGKVFECRVCHEPVGIGVDLCLNCHLDELNKENVAKKISKPEYKKEEDETIDGYKCLECGELIDTSIDSIDVPLYECNNCGTVFNRDNSYSGSNHQCPDCLKFASKRSETSCPHCQAGEVEECELIRHVDGELEEA